MVVEHWGALSVRSPCVYGKGEEGEEEEGREGISGEEWRRMGDGWGLRR
jgi:hypothetical protein